MVNDKSKRSVLELTLTPITTSKMVHIIGVNASTCTQRVLTVLAEKGVTDFTLYAPNFMVGEHKVGKSIIIRAVSPTNSEF